MIQPDIDHLRPFRSMILGEIFLKILSWPNEKETADPIYLDGEQEPAAIETTEVRNESEPTPK
jgi:hypothetical protein